MNAIPIPTLLTFYFVYFTLKQKWDFRFFCAVTRILDGLEIDFYCDGLIDNAWIKISIQRCDKNRQKLKTKLF